MDPRDAISVGAREGTGPGGSGAQRQAAGLQDHGLRALQVSAGEEGVGVQNGTRPVIQIKEIKMRPKTGEHDYQFKVKKIRGFLEKGMKVKATIMFRGREVVHAELGARILARIAEEVAGCGRGRARAANGRAEHVFVLVLEGEKLDATTAPSMTRRRLHDAGGRQRRGFCDSKGVSHAQDENQPLGRRSDLK